MLPVNCVPLMLIDANAQMAVAKPLEDSNATLFGCFLERHELLHTKARDDNGDEICTWQSPNGLRICIDYVVLPLALSEAIQGQGVFSQFRGLVDHDHRPVWIDIALRREASSRVRAAPLDYNFLRTDRGRAQLAHMLQALPPIPWETGVDDHLHQIHQHITQGLATICPKRPSHARGKVTSDGTWDLIRARRQLRRELHVQLQTTRLEALAPFFAAWKGRAADASVNLHLQRLHASLMALQIRSLSKLITRSARQDAAHAAKATFAEARRAGPEALSRLFRSILKTGRRYRAPHVAPAIIKEGKVVENSIAAIGDHFAAAERAQLTSGDQICNPKPAEEETALQVCEAFSIPSIAHAFGNLATRKAAGVSGIPAEVYSLAPIQAANCHLPLITKLQTRRQVPLLWKGGKAVPIEKPHKNLALPSGWRSILLVEAGAKGLGRAMRQCLLRGYEQLRVEGQGGSRPKAPMQVAMGLIRGFVAELQAKGTSGGVVFIDGQAAFYSTIRQALVGRHGSDSIDGLRRLSEVLFQTEQERLQFIATALAPGLMEESGVPIEVRRVVAATLDRTWFGVGDSCELTYSTLTGTTPGAPLADLAFQYIFSTILRQIQGILKDIDCKAFVGDRAEIQVPPPTWMDDLAVPFCSNSAQAVVPTAKLAVEAVSEELARIGIAVNTGPGKSELLPIFNGPGSKAERRQWCTNAEPVFTATMAGGTTASVHITPTYIHLGSVVDVKAGDGEDIRRRRVLARELLRPLMRLLCNEFLTPQEKTNLLLAMPVARLKHGCGLWRLQRPKDRALFHAAFMELLRRAFRPILGVSSRGLSDEEICNCLGVLSPDELRSAEILRTAAWLAADRSRANDFMWLQQGDWKCEAEAAAKRCAAIAAPSCEDPWRYVQDHPEDIRRWVRAFERTCRRRRSKLGETTLPQWRAVAAARRQGWFFCHLQGEKAHSRQYQCDQCGAVCGTAAALASHKRKRHLIAARSKLAAVGTRCEVCQREFWSSDRLAQHLRKATHCLIVAEAADLDAGVTVKPRYSFAWPPAATFQGPKPFWATRHPDPPEEPAREVPDPRWPTPPSLSKGIHSERLDGFVKELVEFSIRERPHPDDMPLSLLAAPNFFRDLFRCCIEIAAEIPAQRAGWTDYGTWCAACCSNRVIFRPKAAVLADELPPIWAQCFA